MAEIVTMPKLGFDMAEGTLVRWVIHEGEQVAKGAVLAEIETDKATVEVESNFSGIVLRHLVSEGDIVPVNERIAVIGEAGEEVDIVELPAQAGQEVPSTSKREGIVPGEIETAPETKVEVQQDAQLPGGVKASPLARRMAEQKGINLADISGSGPGGRIVKKDIQAYASTSGSKGFVETVLDAPALEPARPRREDQVVPLNRLRSAIGRRMTEAKQQVPHFYITTEYDMAAVMDLRRQYNSMLPEDEKTSVNDYLIKAVALTLREFPNLNASLREDQVIRHGQINIGVAVAVDSGLLTVVSRDTDQTPLRLISSQVRAMVNRARAGKVKPEDIEGSTFSVSNLGMYDVDHFIAIINPPEAAILASGSVRQVPVIRDGNVEPGLRMKATISVDHRVSDGAEAARFMQALASYLEEPLRLLL